MRDGGTLGEKGCVPVMRTPQAQIESAAHAISKAVMVLKMEMPTIEAFLKEARDMENFGHIADPTLYNKSERKAVSALLVPLFQAAVTFTAAYEDHIKKAKAALEKVQR